MALPLDALLFCLGGIDAVIWTLRPTCDNADVKFCARVCRSDTDLWKSAALKLVLIAIPNQQQPALLQCVQPVLDRDRGNGPKIHRL